MYVYCYEFIENKKDPFVKPWLTSHSHSKGQTIYRANILIRVHINIMKMNPSLRQLRKSELLLILLCAFTFQERREMSWQDRMWTKIVGKRRGCQIDAWVRVFLCARTINLTDLLTSSLALLLIIRASSLKSPELIWSKDTQHHIKLFS